MNIRIGIADDHSSFLQSISLLISSTATLEVIIRAGDGKDLIRQISASDISPSICLVDVNMPVLAGPATIESLGISHPHIKTIALSMEQDDFALIRMLRAGCRGWWLKYQNPDELIRCVLEVDRYGYYNGDPLNVFYRDQTSHADPLPITLDPTEIQLLRLFNADLSVEEIGAQMNVSEESLRISSVALYDKLHVRSRTGAVLEACRLGITGPPAIRPGSI